MMGAGEAERKGLRGPSGAGAGPHAALAPGGGGEKGGSPYPGCDLCKSPRDLGCGPVSLWLANMFGLHRV